MDIQCVQCGAPMNDGEPHCSKCHASMVCDGSTCSCACGNTVSAEEIKCDLCLDMEA